MNEIRRSKPDQHDLETHENCIAVGEQCVSLRKTGFGPLVEDDEADEEALFEEELSYEKFVAPHGLEWSRQPRREEKNTRLMEVNTVTNEKGEDLWTTVDSGASENVTSDWMAPQFKEPSTGSRVQYVAANGHMMPNKGEKDVKVISEEGPVRLFGFSMLDTNKVTFTKAGGIIEHVAIGQRTKFQRVDCVYRLKVGVVEEISAGRGMDGEEFPDIEFEVENESEEGRVPKVFRDPGVPTETEIEQQNVTHLPFRLWCPSCVEGKVRDNFTDGRMF